MIVAELRLDQPEKIQTAYIADGLVGLARWAREPVAREAAGPAMIYPIGVVDLLLIRLAQGLELLATSMMVQNSGQRSHC